MKTNIKPDSKINELTVKEFKELISESIREILEDIIEDREASSSKNYISSIKEAREEYKAGNISSHDDVNKYLPSKMKGVKYLVDENGEKKAVVIDLKQYRNVWEHFYDVMISIERENEETTSWDTLQAELREDERKGK
ncbi:MAG: hypothetical protein WC879_03785 [Melioribacteraceae bacterium]